MTKSRPSSRNLGSPRWDGYLFKFLNALLCVSLLFGASSCGKKEVPFTRTLTEAQKKFEQKCREEFDLHVITKMVGKTFWIYLPTKDPIFDYESTKSNAAEAKKKPKYAVQFVDGNFKDNRFFFEYDIIERKKSKVEDYGYNSSYTDSYIKQQNNLFTAISDAFFSVKPDKNEEPIEFFVIIITDIKKGIETSATFYLLDFKRFMSGDLPYDEYVKRFLADTKGGPALIGDETGSHIEYKEMLMPEFLTKQILNRINYKFQHSDFPPEKDYDDAIVNIIADTTRYYTFTAFDTVQLHNLRLEKKYIFERSQLATFGEESKNKTPDHGKLIHIRFENGETKITE